MEKDNSLKWIRDWFSCLVFALMCLAGFYDKNSLTICLFILFCLIFAKETGLLNKIIKLHLTKDGLVAEFDRKMLEMKKLVKVVATGAMNATKNAGGTYGVPIRSNQSETYKAVNEVFDEFEIARSERDEALKSWYSTCEKQMLHYISHSAIDTGKISETDSGSKLVSALHALENDCERNPVEPSVVEGLIDQTGQSSGEISKVLELYKEFKLNRNISDESLFNKIAP